MARAWGFLLQLGATYIQFIKDAMEGNSSRWLWNAPDWKDIKSGPPAPWDSLQGRFAKTAQASMDTYQGLGAEGPVFKGSGYQTGSPSESREVARNSRSGTWSSS